MTNNIRVVPMGVPCGFSMNSENKLYHVKKGKMLLGTITDVGGCFRALVLSPRGDISWHKSKADAVAAFK